MLWMINIYFSQYIWPFCNCFAVRIDKVGFIRYWNKTDSQVSPGFWFSSIRIFSDFFRRMFRKTSVSSDCSNSRFIFVYTRSDASSNPSKVWINREGNVLETVFPIAVLAGKAFLSASSIHFSSSSVFLKKFSYNPLFQNPERKLKNQPFFCILVIDVGQLLDSFKPVEQGAPVDEQGLGSLQDISFQLQIDLQSPVEFRFVFLIVLF